MRQLRFRKSLLTSFSFILLISPKPPSGSEPCDDCYQYIGEDQIVHGFLPWIGEYGGWRSCFDHLGCHQDEELGLCNLHSSSSCSESNSQAIEAAAWVRESHDAPEELTSFLRRNSRVSLNQDRSALQVRGCGGEIIGHFPLTEGSRLLGDKE